MKIQVHLPSPVGSRPVEVILWARSSVARIAVPPNCLGFEIGISVLLFATDERNRRKYGRARSVHWSSGGRSCQHSPVSEQQKRSMSSFFRLVNRCRFFG